MVPDRNQGDPPVALQINVGGHHNLVYVDRSAIDMASPSPERVYSQGPSARSRLGFRLIDLASRTRSFVNEVGAATIWLLRLLGAA